MITKVKPQYKTVGQAAFHINKNETQEVGETLEMMEKKYAEELQECLNLNKKHTHYYIVVLRKKEPMSPVLPVSNVLRQWFIAPRFTKPSARVLKKDYPLQDHDVWEVKDGNPQHVWTLPGPDAWDFIMQNKRDHDPHLVKWMTEYEKGTLK